MFWACLRSACGFLLREQVRALDAPCGGARSIAEFARRAQASPEMPGFLLTSEGEDESEQVVVLGEEVTPAPWALAV